MTVRPRVSATLTRSAPSSGGHREDQRVPATDQGAGDVRRDQTDEADDADRGDRRRGKQRRAMPSSEQPGALQRHAENARGVVVE